MLRLKSLMDVQLESIRNEDEETADGCPICQEHFGHRGAQEIVILDCLHRVSQDFDAAHTRNDTYPPLSALCALLQGPACQISQANLSDMQS